MSENVILLKVLGPRMQSEVFGVDSMCARIDLWFDDADKLSKNILGTLGPTRRFQGGNDVIENESSLSYGDVIEINGKRRTVAKCLPHDSGDVGQGIIRLDSEVRQNAGIEIGDMVSIQKIKCQIARQISVIPQEPATPYGQMTPSTRYIDERYLADALESVPLMKGDTFSLKFFGTRVRFRVVKIECLGIDDPSFAMVSQQTTFILPGISRTHNGMIEGKTNSECKCPSCETDVDLLDEYCKKCGHKLDVIDITSNLLEEWVSAVESNDVNQVVDLYRGNAIVLGLDENYEEGIGYGDIISKFNDIKSGLEGSTQKITILSQNPRVFGSVAINSGQCRWHLEDTHTDEWFSFVYNKDDDGVWKIVSHHRSYYEAPQTISEE
jgi:ketosteroid isomerase-like protein